MSGRPRYAIVFSFVLNLILMSPVGADLVGWWAFDEGSGDVVHDSSGNGNDGFFEGDPQWVSGQLGTALAFDGAGDWLDCASHSGLDIGDAVSMTAWIQVAAMGIDHKVGGNQDNANGGYKMSIFSNNRVEFEIRTAANNAVLNRNAPGGTVLETDAWHHVTGVYSFDGGYIRTYVNGVLDRELVTASELGISPGRMRIGCEPFNTGSYHFDGIIDDVRVYDHALTEEEIRLIMVGGAPAERASNPVPADGAVDVPRDVVLGWKPGVLAVTHDVYLGTSFDDVNTASRSHPLDVLVNRSQASATYDPWELLEFNRTYYWRIDEVNAAPDHTIFKGDVWGFTVEPYAYPVSNVLATSNGSAEPGAGPVNTINGSGLTDSGAHSMNTADMWLTSAGADPLQVQYEFDKVYKLHEMLVWNYNGLFESVIGFGLKDVTVEYSYDGTDWVVLGEFEFAQAAGTADYVANTKVDLQGVTAKSVRLVVNSGWGSTGQFGLSEVRFTFIPVRARDPRPSDGAKDVDPDVTLGWRPGREAGRHEVHLSADVAGVASGKTQLAWVDEPLYTPSDLLLGTRHYWRIDEVNENEATSLWAGDVWSFATKQFVVIDDMESYDDDENRIFDAWFDGYINGTGATVGYLEAPFAERKTVSGGRQSMPFQYENMDTPFYSEAEFDLDLTNWSANGADTLRLFVSGRAPGFFRTADGGILMNGIGADIWGSTDEFRYVYKQLTGDGSLTARVASLNGRPSGWAKGGVMIRNGVEPFSQHAFTAMTGGFGGGAAFQRRINADQGSTSDHGLPGGPFAPPYWVRIARVGNAFNSFISVNGETWVQAGDTLTIEMNDPVLVGLAVTSHNVNQATHATFSNISTTGDVTGDWQMAEIGRAQPEGNSPEPLYVTIEDTNGNTAVATHPDATITVWPGWDEWLIPYSDLAGVDLSRVATVSFGAGDRSNPQSGGTGVVYVDDIGIGRPIFGRVSPLDVTRPGDVIQPVPSAVGGWDPDSPVRQAIDGRVDTKYWHFAADDVAAGLQVVPSIGATIITGLKLTTANDRPDRDPIVFELSGSNEGIDGPYTLIAAGEIVDFAGETEWPRFTPNITPITFQNETAYASYQLLFPTVRGNLFSPFGGSQTMQEDGVQIAEVELLGKVDCLTGPCLAFLAGTVRDIRDGYPIRLDDSERVVIDRWRCDRTEGFRHRRDPDWFEIEVVHGECLDVTLTADGYHPRGSIHVELFEFTHTIRDFVMWPTSVSDPTQFRPVFRFRWRPGPSFYYFTEDADRLSDLLFDDNHVPADFVGIHDPHNWMYNGIAFCALRNPVGQETAVRCWMRKNDAKEIPAYAFSESQLEPLDDPSDAWVLHPRLDNVSGVFHAYRSRPGGELETTAVHRYWSKSGGCYFYTLDRNEPNTWQDEDIPLDWEYRGEAWHVSTEEQLSLP